MRIFKVFLFSCFFVVIFCTKAFGSNYITLSFLSSYQFGEKKSFSSGLFDMKRSSYKVELDLPFLPILTYDYKNVHKLENNNFIKKSSLGLHFDVLDVDSIGLKIRTGVASNFYSDSIGSYNKVGLNNFSDTSYFARILPNYFVDAWDFGVPYLSLESSASLEVYDNLDLLASFSFAFYSLNDFSDIKSVGDLVRLNSSLLSIPVSNDMLESEMKSINKNLISKNKSFSLGMSYKVDAVRFFDFRLISGVSYNSNYIVNNLNKSIYSSFVNGFFGLSFGI